MTTGTINRPFKFGERDRREFIVQDSEVSLAAINDSSANPIFIGRAKAGEPLSDNKWQLRKITYDAGDGVVRVEWPQNDEGNASTNFEFIWSTVSALTITGITQANPAVVTVSSAGTIQNGDQIVIQGVEGMTEVNFTGDNLYTVANLSGSTFELSGIDSSAFTAYTSDGTVEYGEALNYTYA